MDLVHVIRHKVLVEGKSRRQVAEEFGVSRNTVKKYVEAEDPTPVRVESPRASPVRERAERRAIGTPQAPLDANSTDASPTGG